ncbi:unnamed protein product [Acanthoscelides obtectus]|uniref:Uncharacterized protein n=1 Tax=Acanthoscelides obtectus TaxID=200917 RepID=A0A9P0NTS8_ACAOB|nr:unnamed protein product [Acanthoscelides obtectus]CAK1654416.1 hypothetical protein AOBTE_LOCUS18572 [Acanthoscelides obtectus]
MPHTVVKRQKKGDYHWSKYLENTAGAVTFPSRVQKFFLGSLLRYGAWRSPARIPLSSD